MIAGHYGVPSVYRHNANALEGERGSGGHQVGIVLDGSGGPPLGVREPVLAQLFGHPFLVAFGPRADIRLHPAQGDLESSLHDQGGFVGQVVQTVTKELRGNLEVRASVQAGQANPPHVGDVRHDMEGPGRVRLQGVWMGSLFQDDRSFCLLAQAGQTIGYVHDHRIVHPEGSLTVYLVEHP